MEVHHHPDLHHKSKKFKEYFLEFLMIFLAVTLGFFAENIREYFSDRDKERKYVKTLYHDLKDDTANLNGGIPFWQSQLKRIDTLRTEIKKGDHMNPKVANMMASAIRFYGNFLYHDRTIAQLKSTGNFRLLDAALADSIMEYDSYITSQLRDQEAHGQKLYIETNNLQNKIFESGIWQLYQKNGLIYIDSLLTADPNAFKIHTENKELLFEFYNSLDFWQIGINWRLRSSLHLERRAVNMMQLIENQYHIENK
ncbi:MAG TPA: hypothetical protein VKR32_19805 [Puia sp.]|nr:hypothetical protein [Puia sp.]